MKGTILDASYLHFLTQFDEWLWLERRCVIVGLGCHPDTAGKEIQIKEFPVLNWLMSLVGEAFFWWLM